MTRLKLSDLPLNMQKQIFLKGRKRSKYGSRKIEIDGHVFDSKKEGEYYQQLKLRKMAGEIKDFELQPEFTLQEGFKKNGKTYREIKYIADFKVIYPDGRVEIVDIKGYETKEFRLKRKLFEYKYPNLELKIIK